MKLLPIVSRELRVASRRQSTYWVRSGTAFLILVIAAWALIVMRDQPTSELAMGLFAILTGFAFIYGWLSGMRYTADALSEEKREGTLGLLFLTDLRSYDIVLGKLAATSLNALYGMIAVLPMLAIPLLLGGVTIGEFGRMSLLALNTLFLSLSIGLCASACARASRKSMMATFLVLVLLTGLLPALGAYLGSIGKVRILHPFFFLPSPAFAYGSAFSMRFAANAKMFWYSMLTVHALGWVALLLATIVVPLSWRDKPAGKLKLRWREFWLTLAAGRGQERAGFRREFLDVNAYYWLAARSALKPLIPWMVLTGCGLVWIWGYYKFRADWLNEGVYCVTGILLCLLAKGWFASEVTRQLAEDRQTGALELVLSTPFTVPDILHGQWLALRKHFVAPLALILFILVVLMVATLRENLLTDKGEWTIFWVSLIIMLIADVFALYWVGMWDGLTAGNPNRAASNALTRILVVPWLAMAVLIALVALAPRTGPGPNGLMFIYAWLILGLITDLGYAVWARQKLLTEFRLAAARKYEREYSGWAKVGRWLGERFRQG